jgi:hypothetical protein
MKNLLVVLAFVVCGTISAQFKTGKFYILYEKEISLCKEEANSYWFFYVQKDDGKELLVNQAFFDKDSREFYYNENKLEKVDRKYLIKHMNSEILPVYIDEGNLYIPLYK